MPKLRREKLIGSGSKSTAAAVLFHERRILSAWGATALRLDHTNAQNTFIRARAVPKRHSSRYFVEPYRRHHSHMGPAGVVEVFGL